MHTKLHILPVQTSQDSAIGVYVNAKQDKSKAYTDAKHSAKIPSFRPGDKVWVRKPFFVKTTQISKTQNSRNLSR